MFSLMQWPPPEILETLRPIAEVCKQRTGVTQGNSNFFESMVSFNFYFSNFF